MCECGFDVVIISSIDHKSLLQNQIWNLVNYGVCLLYVLYFKIRSRILHKFCISVYIIMPWVFLFSLFNLDCVERFAHSLRSLKSRLRISMLISIFIQTFYFNVTSFKKKQNTNYMRIYKSFIALLNIRFDWLNRDILCIK